MVKRTKKGMLLAPYQPINIPNTSQWLAGQGAGSWYHITKSENNDLYIISRFNPSGLIEFEASYKVKGNHEFSIDCPYAFTYLSHLKSCNILQHGEKINFVKIELLS